MSTSTRLFVFSACLLVLAGCDAEPDEGAPRAPLPSEIKPSPATAGGGGTPKPRSMPEAWKALQEKKAKEAADNAAAEAASATPKDQPPGNPETPKPAAPPAATPSAKTDGAQTAKP